MTQTTKTEATYCRICGQVAMHTITDDRHQTCHLCCTHYQKFFLPKDERCTHAYEEYPTVTYDAGKFNGYSVKVSYRILPENEWRLKRQAVVRILFDAALKQEMAKQRNEREKEKE